MEADDFVSMIECLEMITEPEKNLSFSLGHSWRFRNSGREACGGRHFRSSGAWPCGGRLNSESAGLPVGLYKERFVHILPCSHTSWKDCHVASPGGRLRIWRIGVATPHL